MFNSPSERRSCSLAEDGRSRLDPEGRRSRGSHPSGEPPSSGAIIDAVAYAAIALLRSRDVNTELPGVLRTLGEAVGVSRVYVYQNLTVDGQLADIRRLTWTAVRVRPPANEGTASFYVPQYERYVRILGTGGIIAELASEAPEEEREWLVTDETLSYTLVPIFVGSGWWGYIGFDDCWYERSWSAAELSALRVAAETIGAALERQEMDSSLVEIERRYRTFIEQAPDIIVYSDHPLKDDVTTYVSPQIEEILGVTPERWVQAEGASLWLAMIHPDDRERVERQYEEFLKGGPDIEDYRMVREDGRVVWIRDHAKLVTGPDGLPVEWGVYVDITHQIEAQQRLQEAEKKFQVLVEKIPAITYIYPIEGTAMARYMSPQIEAVTGYSAGEWTAEPDSWDKTVHPEDRDLLTAVFEQADSTLEPYSLDYRVVASDGRTVWFHEEAHVVRSDDGRPLYWLGVILDVSRHKDAEELERALAVEKATTIKLRELDGLKDQFLAGVSHDLRTPLSSILGFAMTLDENFGALSETQQRDFINRITINARKVQELVDDLLDVHRLNQGVNLLEALPVDIGALVDELIDHADYLAKHEVTVETASVVVAADPVNVRRIVENLLTNTARHTPAGTQVWVKVSAQPDGVLICVDDAGPGIPSEEKNRLFEEFTRGADGPRENWSPGLGVGLSLVARFADLHGGRAWVEDRPGGGSSFRVSLPKGQPPGSPSSS